MDDEKFYEQVSEEVKKGIIMPGLQAKAFSEANGMEPQAQALYIKYRAKQLIEQHRSLKKNQAKAEHERSKKHTFEGEANIASGTDERLTAAHFIALGVFFLIIGVILVPSII